MLFSDEKTTFYRTMISNVNGVRMQKFHNSLFYVLFLFLRFFFQKKNFITKFILINFIPRFILTCCFESFWVHTKTPPWNDWTNLLLQLIPNHMQETNFITQLILGIKLNDYSLSFWARRGMSDPTHFKQPTNICCFHRPLFTSKNSASYLNLFVSLWDIPDLGMTRRQ